ncbi:hypothetical protein ABNQ39_20870 [Azospirillum sp. A26]|uniref:hypothetical protein n=1 Tax=unclassified Azospirillum TaxID=2630922 RepID=UPI000D61FAE8|nr:hypothetical protein [Azospirillum sp. TSA6c]PWC54250.1 hypothetical protein TSA6c_00565 [Azospirillum sp. TSA6c]
MAKRNSQPWKLVDNNGFDHARFSTYQAACKASSELPGRFVIYRTDDGRNWFLYDPKIYYADEMPPHVAEMGSKAFKRAA